MPAGELRKQYGFTLIELLVTLMIAAIIAIMAVPAFAGFLARQQLASDVNDMISVLSFARGEAIKQRSEMSVIVSPPTAIATNRRPSACRHDETVEVTGEGPRYRYSNGCYWVVKRSAGDEVLRVGQSANIASPNRTFSLTFQPLGDADIDDCPSNPCLVTISPQRELDNVGPITLAINITGSIRRQESVR